MKRNRRLIGLMLAAALVLQTAGMSVWTGIAGKAEAATNGPAVVSTYPGNGESNVPGNVNLKVTFDEPVAKGAASSYIHVRRVDTNEEVNTISASSNYVTMNATGYVANISMPNTLSAGVAYYVRIDQGAFVNASNNANFAGLNDATSWRFNVGGTDTAAPYVTAFEPVSGATNVSPTSWWKMTFSEPVYAATGLITLTRTGGDTQTIDVGAAAVTGSGTNVITINPGVLQASSAYTVSVPSGAFKDGAGNSYAGNPYWSFTTAAPPLSVNIAPANNSSGVSRTDALTMTVTGAASLTKGTGNFTIKRIGDNSVFQQIDVNSGYVSIAGNAVSIQHNEFEANKSYYVLVDPGVFKNESNVSYQGIASASEWTFSTAMAVDSTKPNVSELYPANGGSIASEAASLVMTFDEPVYPGGGTITIKNSLTNAVFQSIPVTSTNVKGGGTNKITIDHNTFVANTTYYVQVSEQAFRDYSNNYYNGISSTTGWSFRISSDSTPPVISALTPANGTNSVGTQAPISILFNEQVQVTQATGSVFIRKSGASTGAIAASIAVDASDARKVNLTPQTALTASTSYYVEISDNAITDLSGNRFAGIQNTVQWAFSTIGTDKTAPALSNAAMSGSSTIVLTFNEQLDPNVIPQPGSFYVTVNGESRAVIATAVSGTNVTLTLINGVLFGQTVAVTYAKGDKAIQDLSGNQAASISSRAVTNTLDTTLPKPVSGSVNGSTVILNFNQTMSEPNANAYSQFTVRLNGNSTYVSQVHTGGNLLYLVLGTTVTDGAAVSVSYTQGSYPVVDSNGNALQAFTDFYVKNAADKTAPVIQSANVSGGNKLTLTYNEGLDTTTVPGKASYSVIAAGLAKTISAVELMNNQVVLTLSTSIANTATVLVTYVPGSNSVRDLNGNQAVGFSGLQATVNGTGSGGTTSGSRQAIIDGAALKLYFSETLSTSYTPKVTQFSVKVDGASFPVAAVSVNNTYEVALTLYTAVTSANTVIVSYTSDSSGLRNQSGVLISSFSNQSVVNITTAGSGTGSGTGSGGTSSGNFDATPEGAIVLQSSHYMVSSSTSPGGQTANMYTVIEESLNNGFKAARSISSDSPKVVLTIPSTEKAGLASIPLQALENAKNVGGAPVVIIQYGDITYEIPCAALDYSQIMKILNVGGTTGYLVIKIDKTAPNLTASLTSALNRSGAVTFVAPMHMETSVMVAGVSKELPSYSKYVTFSVKTANTMTARQTAVVWVDPATGVISYVPTKVEANGSTGSKVSFMRKGNGDYAVIKGNVSYSDLGTHWASNSILLLANKYIVEGRSTTKYEPNKPVTRGEFAMFIARGLGLSGDKAAAAAYSDLNTSTALAAYIGAVSKAGIVTGNSDGTFKPSNFITRQEAAAMLNRAATYAGATISLPQTVDTYLQRFSDRKQIGTWAKQDVAKSVNSGFMTGVTSTTFVPQSNTTRAEAAIMIQRMLTYVGFLQS